MERAIGIDAHGHAACPACRSTTPRTVAIFRDALPGHAVQEPPAPAHCPRCGKDPTNYVEVVFVDRIARRLAHEA